MRVTRRAPESNGLSWLPRGARALVPRGLSRGLLGPAGPGVGPASRGSLVAALMARGGGGWAGGSWVEIGAAVGRVARQQDGVRRAVRGLAAGGRSGSGRSGSGRSGSGRCRRRGCGGEV